VVQKELQIHAQSALGCVAVANWAFAGWLMANIVEYMVYAVRFQPSTKAYDFWNGVKTGDLKNFITKNKFLLGRKACCHR
jgi:hypothetical protein